MRAFATLATSCCSTSAALLLAPPAAARSSSVRIQSTNGSTSTAKGRNPTGCRLVRILSKRSAFKDPEPPASMSASSAGVTALSRSGPTNLSPACCRCRPATNGCGARHRVFGPAALAAIAAGHRAAAADPIRNDRRLFVRRLPTLDAVALDQSPTWLERLKMSFSNTATGAEATCSQRSCSDTLWGVYFATGSEAPVRVSSRCCRGRRSATTSSG